MYYSSSTTTNCLHKDMPKIVNTIRINGKYFDAAMVKERVLIALSASAVISVVTAICAVILF